MSARAREARKPSKDAVANWQESFRDLIQKRVGRGKAVKSQAELGRAIGYTDGSALSRFMANLPDEPNQTIEDCCRVLGADFEAMKNGHLVFVSSDEIYEKLDDLLNSPMRDAITMAIEGMHQSLRID